MAFNTYSDFLDAKSHYGEPSGFTPLWLPSSMFDFQAALAEWAIEQGRAAIFADCGLGKTLIELVWAENISRKTNKRVLILTPLAVSAQTVREGEKFGIECHRSSGEISGGNIRYKYTSLTKRDRLDCASRSGVL